MAKAKIVKTVKNKEKVKKVKSREVSAIGKAFIFSGYNNTIVTVTDLEGNTICWGSSGKNNFKGSRKSTPYAATVVGENVAKTALSKGVKEVAAYMKGVGSGKSQCVKALRNGGLVINRIIDITPMAHNGCRAKKRRRV